jgi:hypothetical protein
MNVEARNHQQIRADKKRAINWNCWVRYQEIGINHRRTEGSRHTAPRGVPIRGWVHRVPPRPELSQPPAWKRLRFGELKVVRGGHALADGVRS